MSSDIIRPHLVQPVATNVLAGLITALGAGFGGVGVLVDLVADAVDLLPVWILVAGFPSNHHGGNATNAPV